MTMWQDEHGDWHQDAYPDRDFALGDDEIPEFEFPQNHPRSRSMWSPQVLMWCDADWHREMVEWLESQARIAEDEGDIDTCIEHMDDALCIREEFMV